MPEMRRDPITGEWVVIAAERSKRPSDFTPPASPGPKGSANCPFCPGHEQETPPEVLAYREHGERDTPGWRVRVVPNKFAALNAAEEPGVISGDDLYFTRTGAGVHEVIIESPEHQDSWADFSITQATLALQAWAERYRELEADAGLAYVQIFTNHGALGGASLEHPHSQLIATPFVPPRMMHELEGASSYFREHHRCPYCDLVAREEESRTRLVERTENYLACCPYASRFPLEMWVLPREHTSSFGGTPLVRLQELGGLLRRVYRQLSLAADDPPYNAVLHTRPLRETGYDKSYHWHLEILPRLTTIAGFEWGTGIFINPTPPETAREYLAGTE